jgi:hypothetical protein
MQYDIVAGTVDFWKHYESKLEPVREILEPVKNS